MRAFDKRNEHNRVTVILLATHNTTEVPYVYYLDTLSRILRVPQSYTETPPSHNTF